MAQDLGAVLASEDPATGTLHGPVRQATASDCHAVATATHKAFERWSMVPARMRGEHVRRIGNAFREQKSERGEQAGAESPRCPGR